MLEEDTTQAIVIDIGSQNLRVGLSGELKPRYILPTAVGNLKYRTAFNSVFSEHSDYIDDRLHENRAILSIKYAIDHGTVTNWDNMEKLLHYAIYNHNWDAPEHPLLVTKPVYMPTKDAERMTEIAFETLEVPAFHMVNASELAFQCLEQQNGIILDVGHGVTSTYPVINGQVIRDGVIRQNFAGADVSDILGAGSYHVETSEQNELLREMKEKFALVALDYDQVLKECRDSSTHSAYVTLPNKEGFDIEDQRFKCSEILFQPKMVGKNVLSVVDLVIESIKRSERKELYENIILMGGCTDIPGFTARFEKELVNSMNGTTFKVSKAPDHCAWVGGAILAAKSEFTDIATSRGDYDEHGPSIIHRNKNWL
jgi:actin-related protein